MTEPAIIPDLIQTRRRNNARRERHNAHLARLEAVQAESSSSPATVSFRELVGPLPADESSHSIYPYPGRLVRHIPRFFLESDAIDPNARVIDPFCGSGTVLLEAKASGRASYGIDSNPVAVLIAAVKTTPLTTSIDSIDIVASKCVARVRTTRRRIDPPSYVSKWYSPAGYSALARLSWVVRDTAAQMDSAVGNILLLALARASLETSVRDARIPVPVRDVNSPNARATTTDVTASFMRAVTRIATAANRIPRRGPAAVVTLGDARDPAAWPLSDDSTPSVMLTSPPYGAAQKYIRSTSLEAGWLGHASARGTRTLERTSIGREHLDQFERYQDLSLLADPEARAVIGEITAADAVRGDIYFNYFLDMQAALVAGIRTSMPDTVILIGGTNRVADLEVETHQYLANTVRSEGYGLRLALRDEIRGRTLLTSRHRGAQPAAAELVYLFERRAETRLAGA